MDARRILAIIGLCAWGALIATTVVVAFTVDENTHALFNGLIAADIMVPVLIWVLMMIIRAVKRRREQLYEEYEESAKHRNNDKNTKQGKK